MNTGQMLITLGAMILLSMVIIRTNTVSMNTGEMMYQTKYSVLAVSLGTSMMEEITSKAFDQNTDTASVTNLATLTAPVSLGKDGTEAYPNFNDIDDFNGLIKLDTTIRLNAAWKPARFTISCVVGYIDKTGNPNNIITNKKTWDKKIEITVTSPLLKEPVKLSSVFSYWFFR